MIIGVLLGGIFVKVYFLYGKESGLWGIKIWFLVDIVEEMGC